MNTQLCIPCGMKHEEGKLQSCQKHCLLNSVKKHAWCKLVRQLQAVISFIGFKLFCALTLWIKAAVHISYQPKATKRNWVTYWNSVIYVAQVVCSSYSLYPWWVIHSPLLDDKFSYHPDDFCECLLNASNTLPPHHQEDLCMFLSLQRQSWDLVGSLVTDDLLLITDATYYLRLVLYLSMCTCVPVCRHVNVSTSVCVSQKKSSDSLVLQRSVNYPTWMLRVKL